MVGFGKQAGNENRTSCEQIVNIYSNLMSKSIQNEDLGDTLGVGELILESFWESGRALAPKCLYGNVLGGF